MEYRQLFCQPAAAGFMKSATLTALGGSFPMSDSYMAKASPIWCMLLRQAVRFAFALARVSAGRSSAAKMAMMAITTNSSMSVKAREGVISQLVFNDGAVSVCQCPMEIGRAHV